MPDEKRKHPVDEYKGLVLVIDDEPNVCNAVKAYLEPENFYVLTFTDPKQALKLFGQFDIDVVISDIRMPEFSGDDVLRFIRTKYPEVPVIMLTGLNDVRTAVAMTRMGAHNYLIKPVQKDVIVFAVEKALEYRQLLLRNKLLQLEKLKYQKELENRIHERTRQLMEALNELRRIHKETVRILASAVEEKDPYTKGHSNNVRLYAKALADKLGFSEKKIERLEYAALLHDIGKIAISQEILDKPGPLTKKELEIVRQHPIIGERIISNVDFFKDIAPLVRHHHERWDGQGYPDGLRGEEIPFGARLLAVVDSFDAMTSNRPYRNALPLEQVLEIIEKNKGKQFDPDIAQAFLDYEIYNILKQPKNVTYKA